MSIRTLKPLAALLLGAGLLASPLAHAYEEGDWLLKVGVSHVHPKSNNGDILDGAAKLSVGNSTRPSLSLTYMATRNIGIELLGAIPFSHDINADGAVNGYIGKTKHLPPTLSLQWHFLPDSTVQPYVGVGLNYTTFFDTKARGDIAGNKLRLSDSWGVAAQVGVDVALDKNWFINADVRYIDISSNVKLNGDKIGKAKIDPWVGTLAIGYRF
ncbi:OmpW/AlkL family protein [Kerstersia sp.]|uniref:OmpW/AlkL family protein n=1 Tax=Kerstersia sp. TaxID=1930783 RepID=UPI003F91F945